jgi:hypothetical protein
MSMYSDNNEYGSSWSASKIVGAALTFLGACVILWTVWEIFQLFTQGSAFIVLDTIVPQRILISEFAENALLLPRELLIFGIPIWAMTVTSRIGVMLMKSGLQYVELPQRGGLKPSSSS